MKVEGTIAARLALSKPVSEPAGTSNSDQQVRGTTGLAAIFPELAPADGQVLYEAAGLAVAGAVIGRSLRLEGSGGQFIDPGIHLVVCTCDEHQVLSILGQFLEPLKIERLHQFGPLAELDRKARQETIEQLKVQYSCFQQSDLLPDPEHRAYFSSKIAQLEDTLTPLRLMENPLPGRLVLGLNRTMGPRLLAIYDDRSFSALLETARTARGGLDLELLEKSWRGQPFEGAYLEGLQGETVITPEVWAIIVARPETIGRFLSASEPVVGALADCCLIIDGTVSSSLSQPEAAQVAVWKRIISKLRSSGLAEAPVRISDRAEAATAAFAQRVAKAERLGTIEESRFLSKLLRLASKVRWIRHLAETEVPGWITKAQTEKAIGLVERSIRQRQTIVQVYSNARTQREFHQDCEIVLAKILALGPIRYRDLCHTFDDQRLERWLPILTHLVKTEQILKLPDGRFDIPSRWLAKLQLRIC